jgi:LPXTG-site transpeptidase (sortase) family protein
MLIKRFWKAFVFLFLISFLVINWNQVSWVFNYRVISSLIEDSSKERKIDSEELIGDDSIALTENNLVLERFEYTEKENSLEINKINIDVPLIFVKTDDMTEIEKGLDLGAVHFFNSALPGQPGETIILGHSAPAGWPKIKYDWIFTRINELENNDQITVYFNNRKFNYLVTNKFFLEKGEQTPQYSKDSGNVLVLISCWPPGKDIRRIALEARLID